MSESSAQKRPNVVLIMADDMGYSDIGCYGGEIRTPNLDSLAASGVRFSQMYNGARCCPSRAALLTGVYAQQAGVGHMTNPIPGVPPYQGVLNQSCVTVAEVLRTAGYRTQMSGKWHVGEGPGEPDLPAEMRRGFDRLFGVGGGVESNELPGIVSRLPTSLQSLHLHLHHLTPGWVNFIPPSIKRLSFDMHEISQTEMNRELLHNGLIELRNTSFFTRSLVDLGFHHRGYLAVAHRRQEDQDPAFNDELIESLLLSPNHHPAALRNIYPSSLVVSPDIKVRLRARFPKIQIIWK